MDNSTDYTASPQFSPSKLQAQQAQAKDWAVVDSWLSKRYNSKRLPTFERNEETLQILLNLANLNESADEQRGLIDRIEKAALSSYSKRGGSGNSDKTWQLLLTGPGERKDLDALAETAVALDCPSADISAISAAIVDLTSRKFALDQQIHHIDAQLEALQAEQRKATALLQNLRQEAFQADPNLPEQTSDYLRSAKHMRAKIAEYDDRTTSLNLGSAPESSLEQVIEQSTTLASEQAHISSLQAELQAYQSLPANAKAARSKVESAREELRKLTMQRDRLFEQLADLD